MQRYGRYISSLVLVAVFAVSAYITYQNFSSTSESSYKPKVGGAFSFNEKPETIQRHYVVVTHFTSKKENITKEELLSGSITVLERDKDDISEYLEKDVTTVSSIIGLKPNDADYGILRVDDLFPRLKVLDFEGKSIWEDEDYSLVIETEKDPSSHEASKDKEEFDRSQVVTMSSVGDLMLSRTVYRKMTEFGYMSPFAKVSDKLSSADITFGNLETSISDMVNAPTSGMSFVAPSKSMEGINASGFDVLNLANNHSTNFGLKVYADLLTILDANKVVYVGGGVNASEAKSYKTFESKGKKFAFIGVNSIVGDQAATASSPGNWKITLAPWGNINQTQVDEVVSVITKAKAENDFVIVMPHWGKEYTHDPNDEMKNLAHQIMDAGADLIVGTHPHWTQGIEFYNEELITYSLGNFVFDQEWSQETKEGLILDTIFYKDRLVSAEVIPVVISNYHQPSIVDGAAGDKILNDIWTSSKKIDPGFR